MISDSHPLREFFGELVTHHFSSDVGIRDQEMSAYVANMLLIFVNSTSFTRSAMPRGVR